MEAADALENEPKEPISDSFRCCVCLDLLYKPIVLSCGHVSCFWCVHRCMNGVKESHCPTCRHPFNHFPNICQMLHFLLCKMYPITYKRRETQILEFEKARDCFSPVLKDPVCASRNSEVTQNRAVEENVMSKGDNGTHVRVSITDMLCVACKELLFRPVVLNCGHVYCETCISIPADAKLRCQICQSSHPRGIPKVCLELHHFLETQFPTEYELRKNTIKQVDSQQQLRSAEGSRQSGHFSFSSDERFYPSWADRTVDVHFGVGCDFCGMYPILGTRYRCKDCVEVIGFDLCGDCYTTRSKLPGRFNQQHTAEHSFESFDIVGSDPIPRLISRMTRGDVVNVTGAPTIPENDAENPVSVIAPAVVDDENVWNELVSRLTSASNSEEQSGEQSPAI